MTGSPRITNAVLLERLEMVRCDVSEARGKIDKLIDERTSNAVQHKELKDKLETVSGRAQKNSIDIEELTKVVERLTVPIRILGWIAGLIGAAVIGLLWMIFTHQIVLVFP
jgi:hypothetical protein